MKRRGYVGLVSISHLILIPFLLLNLALAKIVVSENAAIKSRDFLNHRIERVMAEIASGTAPTPSPAEGGMKSRVFHVTDYGADPTGKTDSTAEIARAISDAFNISSDHVLMPGIKDLGGAEIHLDGGSYLISSPITLPSQGGGNMKIHGGTVRATSDFPADRYLIELRSPSPSTTYDYEYITLRDLMLDSSFRGGGVAVVNSLRTAIDNCYIVHFESDGVLIKGGHETLVRGSYIGQHITAGGDPGERNFTGTGININGNDNAVTDTVIFSAGTGVLVSGQANTLTGVHCYNKAKGFGGTGIYLRLPELTQTRISNCYMDFTSIVAEDPVQLVVSGSFFLGDANVVFKSVNGRAGSVAVVDNLFSGGGRGTDIVELDERNGSSWTVDFDSVLLFRDRIESVVYSLEVDEGFPRHALRNVTGNRVVVEADGVVQGTLYVQVDQMSGTKG